MILLIITATYIYLVTHSWESCCHSVCTNVHYKNRLHLISRFVLSLKYYTVHKTKNRVCMRHLIFVHPCVSYLLCMHTSVSSGVCPAALQWVPCCAHLAFGCCCTGQTDSRAPTAAVTHWREEQSHYFKCVCGSVLVCMCVYVCVCVCGGMQTVLDLHRTREKAAWVIVAAQLISPRWTAYGRGELRGCICTSPTVQTYSGSEHIYHTASMNVHREASVTAGNWLMLICPLCYLRWDRI